MIKKKQNNCLLSQVDIIRISAKGTIFWPADKRSTKIASEKGRNSAIQVGKIDGKINNLYKIYSNIIAQRNK